MIVQTVYGAVSGVPGPAGVTAFKGIRFGAAGRFEPAMPPRAWSGVRVGEAYGPAAPQPYDAVLEEMFGQPPFPTSESGCLTLNVWTPASSGARPVMVWLHGGGFMTGSGRDPIFDGARLAGRHDLVVVTVNYRLGVLGFRHQEGEVANLGLLDQVAALEWVRDNIAAFGGDPANVTAFGQSAGAMSVVTLMTMPMARGLFHKAIVQSGSAEHVSSPERASAITREFREVLGRPLGEASIDELLKAQEAVGAAMRARGDGLGLPFAPVVDGTVLPKTPLEAIREGQAADIPLILGTNQDEGRLFLLGPGAPRGEEADAMAAFIGNQHFEEPANRLAEAQAAVSSAVWRYSFGWRSRAHDGFLGACHSLELPFVFDNLEHPGVQKFTGPHPPQSLADEIGRAWASFAHRGDPGPGWPAFDAGSPRIRTFGQ